MASNAGVWLELVFLLLTFFAVAPSPQSFDRETHWMAFVATVAGIFRTLAAR
jgi:hypothetical protein